MSGRPIKRIVKQRAVQKKLLSTHEVLLNVEGIRTLWAYLVSPKRSGAALLLLSNSPCFVNGSSLGKDRGSLEMGPINDAGQLLW